MYPSQSLSALALRREALRQEIGLCRACCAEAAEGILRPLAWADKAWALWRAYAPLARYAALPVGLLIQRAVFPRAKSTARLLRWSSIIWVAVRGVRLAITVSRQSCTPDEPLKNQRPTQ